MTVEIVIPGSGASERKYLTWAPAQATASLRGGPASGTVGVTLRNAGTGGQLVFGAAGSATDRDTLTLQLPANGNTVPFTVAGKFQAPSTVDGDAVIQAVASGSATALGSKAVMVRIRKSADTLTTAERDRFLSALATLNNAGMGKFSDFRNMHVASALGESHGNMGFLPWHRAYLLDLERALQAIDSSVALPYWRFDQPAPNLFTPDFMGVPDSVGAVQFTPGHPLEHWATDQTAGIVRTPLFDTASAPPGLRTEAQTLLMGGSGDLYRNFHTMEGNPHGNAHTSFDGYIDDPATSPKDPLFFLLHANVDRLWAKWQWLKKRFDAADPASYAPSRPHRIGQDLPDSMWPWNGVTTPPRPSTAPGGPLLPSPDVNSPSHSPLVKDMLDYQGVLQAANEMAFDYDDVPFE